MASPAKKTKSSSKPLPDLNEIYGFSFPPQIYPFWKKCQKNSPLNPCKAVKNFNLVGPFKILDQKITFENRLDALMFQRCYHDSPEMLTFAVSQDKLTRLVFYRISPKSESTIVAVKRSEDKENSQILPKYVHLPKLDEDLDFFEIFDQAQKLLNNNSSRPSAERKKFLSTYKISNKIVCDSLTKLGLYVPMKKDIGYRDLQYSDKEFTKILKDIHYAKNDNVRKDNFKPLLEINANIQYANDECDFGMCYEFGYDLFHYGSRYLNKFCGRSLPLAYKLLGWEEFEQVINEHLKNRRDELEVDDFFVV